MLVLLSTVLNYLSPTYLISKVLSSQKTSMESSRALTSPQPPASSSASLTSPFRAGGHSLLSTHHQLVNCQLNMLHGVHLASQTDIL